MAVAAVTLALWQAVVAAGWIEPSILAPPTAVAAGFVKLAVSGELVKSFVTTLGLTAAAAGLAAAIGLPLGYWFWRAELLSEAFESWVGALLAAPTFLLYPLFLVAFGRTYWTVILMGVVVTVVPIVLRTREGLATVRPVLLDVARSFRLPPGPTFFRVLLPAAFPTIFAGLRLGLIYALVNTIGIEFLIDIGGLGRVVADTYDRFDIAQMYAAIVSIVLLSQLFMSTLGWVYRWLRHA